MAIRVVLVVGIFALVCGYGLTQTQTTKPPSSPTIPGPVLPGPPISPIGPPSSSTQPPKEKSLDQMLDELEALRTKKAELEKNEQELVKAIQQKSTKQAERMKNLGLNPAATSDVPKRVGRIIIEGNTVTTDGKILKMINMSSGMVLEYPKLEEARARLQKAKFEAATVEVIPNEWDSVYQDILVKVKEKE